MDTIEDINGSMVQHGSYNDRIYLMRMNTNDVRGLISTLDRMAIKNGYGKIFGKIPEPAWDRFKSSGYVVEAVVPGFFSGRTDGYFVAKYFSNSRQKTPNDENQLKTTLQSGPVPGKQKPRPVKTAEEIVACNLLDAEEMSTIYRKIFKSYPFPIQDPAYLKEMMTEGVLYYSIRWKGRMAAVAATEIDSGNKNTEMTDFATLPKYRGMGLAGKLLNHMDAKTRKLGIKTAYTIARAESRGINSIFKKNGYRYAGLLINNTQISGHIQDMTVWYKTLSS